MDEILTNKQRLKHGEEIKCTNEIKHLGNENSSKNTVIKHRQKIYPDECYM